MGKVKNYIDTFKDKSLARQHRNINLEALSKEYQKRKISLLQSRYISKLSSYFQLSKIHELKEYINSPRYKQIFLEYKVKLKSYMVNHNWKDYANSIRNLSVASVISAVKNFNYRRLSFKNIEFWIKKQLIKIVLFMLFVYSLFYSVKYVYHSFKNRKVERQLRETYGLISDLKEQHKELIKASEELGLVKR